MKYEISILVIFLIWEILFLISFNIYFDQLKIARSKGRSFMYLYFVILALFFISPFLLLLHLFSKKV